ncbi:MAG: hypothetical protein FI717_12100 [SAR202 cluster bacterium]|nr:hypothetical protein [SAR202 cluster bacterium]
MVRGSQVMSEYGEPLSWEVEGGLDAKETVRLCGCGKSKNKPYCDQTHNMVDFEGDETADTEPIASREKTFLPNGIFLYSCYSWPEQTI